jgi:hypothetical protein
VVVCAAWAMRLLGAAALAGALAGVPWPVAAEEPVGLPPASTITGTVHRASNGTIIVDPTNAAPPPSHYAAPAPRPETGPVAPVPPPAPVASRVRPATVDSDTARDEVSCAGLAWENIDQQQCRRELAAVRANSAAGRGSRGSGQ